MSYKSPGEIGGSVQSFLAGPRSLRRRSRSPSYGEGLSACLFGPINTIRNNCKVCHTSCWHAAAEKRYSPTSNVDFFLRLRAGHALRAFVAWRRHRELDPPVGLAVTNDRKRLLNALMT